MVRADILSIRLSGRRGRAQRGKRYAVVIQADDLLGLSTVLICPTSTSAPPASFHPEIAIGGEPTRVLCEMVGAVDSRTLGDQVGHLATDELRAVEDALVLVMALD